MTPDQRAEACFEGCGHGEVQMCIDCIADAIESAVAAEHEAGLAVIAATVEAARRQMKERCAQVAEEFVMEEHDMRELKNAIAAAIRKLG